MSRYPLLEGLRARREREEAEVTAPERDRRVRAEEQAFSLGRRLDSIEQGLAREFAKETLKAIANDMGATLQVSVRRALAKAAGESGISRSVLITVLVDPFMSPASIEQQVLHEYLAQTMRRTSVRIEDGTSLLDNNATVTVMRVDVPAHSASRIMS